MTADGRPGFSATAHLALTLLALGSCSSGNADVPDGPVANGIDAAPGPDAAPPANPTVLWLNDVNGNEGNLRLVGQGPPPPF
jgi:hypothetical protein